MSDCMPWMGHRDRQGYGKVWFFGRSWLAHRLSWVLEHGEIPAGLMVRHHCDNPPCVNPEHLAVGTNRDNVQDSISRGRFHRANGERHGRAQLKWDDVVTIRELAGLVPHRDLAKRFGVSRSAISMVISGRNWGHRS